MLEDLKKRSSVAYSQEKKIPAKIAPKQKIPISKRNSRAALLAKNYLVSLDGQKSNGLLLKNFWKLLIFIVHCWHFFVFLVMQHKLCFKFCVKILLCQSFNYIAAY